MAAEASEKSTPESFRYPAAILKLSAISTTLTLAREMVEVIISATVPMLPLLMLYPDMILVVKSAISPTSLSPINARFVIGRMEALMVAISMPAMARNLAAEAISTAVNLVSTPICRTL